MASNSGEAVNLFDGTHLESRDPDYILRWFPVAELAWRLYFRVRLSGIEKVPGDSPVIFVGNHSGGLSTPDTAMAVYAFWSHWGADRPVYALVHPHIFRMPQMARHIARVGGLAATPRMAQAVMEAGMSMLVYPGAGDEAYRPYTERHLVKLGDRSAYVRLAMRYGAAIVPVVCHGGHDTLLVLDDGRSRAQALGLDRIGIDRVPLTYSWPYGLALGLLYDLPFPKRIDIAFGDPIRFAGFGAADRRQRHVVDWCHAHIERRMQAMLDELIRARAAERARKPSLI
jgi:1-acyl-sn-glycerol-3-phosphate acyltransferase